MNTAVLLEFRRCARAPRPATVVIWGHTTLSLDRAAAAWKRQLLAESPFWFWGRSFPPLAFGLLRKGIDAFVGLANEAGFLALGDALQLFDRQRQSL